MSICKHGNQSNSICRLCMMDQAPASSPRDLEPVQILCSACHKNAVLTVCEDCQSKENGAHPPKGETPSEAAGDLEAMFAQGEIIGYEIDRMPGKASVRLEWMEYAENCPEGWSSTGRGYGPDVPAALEAAKKKMPRKDPQ